MAGSLSTLEHSAAPCQPLPVASGSPLRVLNLYAGLGGNRKLWENVQVTAVEMEPKIAAVYRRLHPADTVIEGDAHQYLLEHHGEYDFIWSSPPCQSHSKMNKATRHKSRRYPDMALYQEIILLRSHARCPWVVENVVPYYQPLIAPSVRMGRHLFWTNFAVEVLELEQPPNFINRCDVAGKQALMDWLGIHYAENIYYGTNHCPAQILRNCVHPRLGRHILEAAKANHALTGAERPV